MPTLQLTDFNAICATLGGFVLLFGLVSYAVKERLYLSEALIALLTGVALGPLAANLITPLSYTRTGTREELESITLAFTRLVLGVQLVLAGVQLPKKYLLHEWRSLAMLLGPVMAGMWLVSSLLVWALIPGVGVLGALAAAACVTPTDPILANAIVKGKFADAHIRPALQKIITAESGANDGLGYPFLFLPLYLLAHPAGPALRLWAGDTIGYVVLLSIAYGAAVGWAAKALLHWSSARGLVDRESFLVFAIALALFIVGTCGALGSDDVLACFVAGNVFTLDDWFRLETLDDSLQPTIDMLLNLSIFLWFGAVAPWSALASPRVIGLAVLVLCLRRPPVVLALHRWIPRMRPLRDAVFAGYFGPIGVSAVFYLYVSTEFLVHVDGGDALAETMRAVVWACVVASVVVHGITIPVVKLGTEAGISVSRLSSMSVGRPRGISGFGTRIPGPLEARAAEEGAVVVVVPPPAVVEAAKGGEAEGTGAGAGRLQFVETDGQRARGGEGQ